jgi:hypothetical protein
MSYKLMVSHNCGSTYQKDMEAETLDDSKLKERMLYLDAYMLRWYIEDENGEQVFDVPCAIHSNILDFLHNLRDSNGPI